MYDCPIYKTVSRFRVLSTTGHSTNFIMFMKIPIQSNYRKWILAGTAAFLATN